jgi:hypothetical protein
MAESEKDTQARIAEAHARPASSPSSGEPGDGLSPGAPSAVRDAAAGGELSAEGNRSAVAWLMQPQRPAKFRVKTQFETEDGTKDLTFRIRQVDSKDIDAIEKRNINETSGRLNRVVANAEIVALACFELVDDTGATVDPTADEFRTTPDGKKLPSKAVAFEQRFFYQEGILGQVADEVRRICGWSPDRVGTAQRELVEAAGN